ncbi:condensation domain-containing protein [Deinococcus multiflagellatus]|uniref:Condensation domain-containing protein n=1 Tax=Deinococcus multiflagellatus TaxID=1656887 RepID=A0ABW1ZV92_9DEIO
MNARELLKTKLKQRLQHCQEAPLTRMQESLWILSQTEDVNSAYTLPFAFLILGPLDIPRLSRSLDRVAERHPILRAHIVDGEEPKQVLSANSTFTLQVTHRPPSTSLQLQTFALEYADQKLKQGRDIHEGNALSVHLITDGQTHVLLGLIHHIFFDGTSVQLFLDEVKTEYAAAEGSARHVWHKSYLDFALQHRATYLEALQTHLPFWTAGLQGAEPYTSLPHQCQRPSPPSLNGKTVAYEVPDELIKLLKTIAEEQGTSLFCVLLLAFQLVLARAAQQSDLVIGVPFDTRAHTDIDRTMGYFINTLPLRTRLKSDMTVAELLKEVTDGVFAAAEHAAVAFEDIVRSLKPERSPSHHPIFQTVFDLHYLDDQHQLSEETQIEHLPIPFNYSKFDLSCTVKVRGESCHFEFEYATDLYRDIEITRFVENFLAMVRALPDILHVMVGELDELADEQRTLLLDVWSGAAQLRGPAQRVTKRIADNFTRFASHVAIREGQRTLTYDAVGRQAQGLIRGLHGLHLSPGASIALYFDKSPEAVVAMLACQFAGYPFVCLDPTLPEERISAILNAVRPEAVLCSNQRLPEFELSGPTVIVENIPPLSGSLDKLAFPEAESLAYLIFTSGSTGQPKGVQVTHANLDSVTAAWDEAYCLSETPMFTFRWLRSVLMYSSVTACGRSASGAL